MHATMHVMQVFDMRPCGAVLSYGMHAALSEGLKHGSQAARVMKEGGHCHGEFSELIRWDMHARCSLRPRCLAHA